MRTIQGPNGSAGGSPSSYSGLTIAGAAMQITAGMTLSAGDLVSLDADNLGYKVTDGLAASNPNQGASVIAITQVVAAANSSFPQEPLVLADKTFATIAVDGSGFVVQRYARNGALLKQLTYAAVPTTLRWDLLANGDIVILQFQGGNIGYAIVPADLSGSISFTTIEASSSNSGGMLLGLLALSGGGFAACWQNSATPTAIRFGIYSNTGTAVLAPTTLYTQPSGTFSTQARIFQFANGNIGVIARNDTTSRPPRLGIFTASGGVVLAFGTFAPMTDDIIPWITVRGDYACVFWTMSNTLKAFVINSAGVQQGTTFTLASVYDGGYTTANRCITGGTDGTDFLLLSFTQSGYNIQVTRLPITGTGATTKNSGKTLGAAGFAILAATYLEGEFIASYVVASTTVHITARIKLDGNFVTSSTVSTAAGAASAPVPFCPGVAIYQGLNASNFFSFAVIRYRDMAVQGVASAAAAKGAAVTALSGVGTAPINPIYCAAPVAFNHNATNVLGQRGTLFERAVALRGLVA